MTKRAAAPGARQEPGTRGANGRTRSNRSRAGLDRRDRQRWHHRVRRILDLGLREIDVDLLIRVVDTLNRARRKNYLPAEDPWAGVDHDAAFIDRVAGLVDLADVAIGGVNALAHDGAGLSCASRRITVIPGVPPIEVIGDILLR
ncbi:hypothetical protein ACX80Z_14415 [Arthrobacter sp. TMT4-20]